MSQGTRQRLQLETIDDVVVVSLTDARIIEEDVIQEVGEQLYSLVDDQGHSRLLLNFSNVMYLSSAALGKLIQLKKKVGNIKGTMKLCCINPDLLEVFKITRLDQVFPIFKDEQSALDSF